MRKLIIVILLLCLSEKTFSFENSDYWNGPETLEEYWEYHKWTKEEIEKAKNRISYGTEAETKVTVCDYLGNSDYYYCYKL